MKKTLLLALSCLAVTASLAMAQGQNYGGQTYLSWSRDATVRDISSACNDQFMYLKLGNIHEVQGVEFGLYWTPAENGSNFALSNVSFPTSAMGNCTYLLRGTVVTVTVTPDDGQNYAIAGAGSTVETACTFGNGAAIDWDFSLSPGGCYSSQAMFALTYVKVTDHNGIQNNMTIVGGCTIGGATPVAPTTWGGIKSLYH